MGHFVERAYDQRSMKAQFKAADRSGAPVALLIGSEELAAGSVTLRALREQRDQVTMPVEDLLEGIRADGAIQW